MHYELIADKIEAIRDGLPGTVYHSFLKLGFKLRHLVNGLHFIHRVGHAEGSIKNIRLDEFTSEIVPLYHFKVFDWFLAYLKTKGCADSG